MYDNGNSLNLLKMTVKNLEISYVGQSIVEITNLSGYLIEILGFYCLEIIKKEFDVILYVRYV